MGIINVKETDSPNTPSTGRSGLFFNTSGVAKRIDDTGTISDLAAPDVIPAVERENNTVLFDKDYITGNAAARTGNVLFDFTGAQLGASTIMKHNDGAAFTFPTENVIISGAYEASVDNYLCFILIDKTASSEVVLCTISQVV